MRRINQFIVYWFEERVNTTNNQDPLELFFRITYVVIGFVSSLRLLIPDEMADHQVQISHSTTKVRASRDIYRRDLHEPFFRIPYGLFDLYRHCRL